MFIEKPPTARVNMALIAVVGLQIVGMSFLTFAQAQEVQNSGAGVTTTDVPTVAVAPFVNISGDAADDWIGSGIAETVSAELEQLGVFSIVGRESFSDAGVSSTSGNIDDAEQAALRVSRRLGAAWLVAGGYQRVGDQLRITARVVSGDNGRIATVVQADGAVSEIFDLQDQIVAELGNGLRSLVDQGTLIAERTQSDTTSITSRGGNGNGKIGRAHV